MSTTRKKADYVEKVAETLRAKFGSKAVTRLGTDDAKSEVTEVIPTGIAPLDHYLFACGGLPVGRMIEVFSDEGGGKSAFLLHCLAKTQEVGGLAVLAETEHAFRKERAETYGVVTPDLLLGDDLGYMENVLLWLETAIKTIPANVGPVLVSWDSLASTPTKREVEEGLDGGATIGERARLLSNAMRVIMPLIARKRVHFLIVNQTRMKIGVMFGPNTTTPGGAAVKFHASMRIQLFTGKSTKDGREHAGKQVTFLALKTRFSPPWRKVQAHLDFTNGWDADRTLLNFAKDKKLIPARSRSVPDALAACQAAKWSFVDTEETVGDPPSQDDDPVEADEGGP